MATVLFLCPYGGAKSVIAASYFNRLAAELALPLSAVPASAEAPYEAVPPPVVAFLEREGFEVGDFKPRRVTSEELGAASKVISIDCDLSQLDGPEVLIEAWNDVPRVSEDLPGSAAAIREHVRRLVDELTS